MAAISKVGKNLWRTQYIGACLRAAYHQRGQHLALSILRVCVCLCYYVTKKRPVGGERNRPTIGRAEREKARKEEGKLRSVGPSDPDQKRSTGGIPSRRHHGRSADLPTKLAEGCSIALFICILSPFLSFYSFPFSDKKRGRSLCFCWLEFFLSVQSLSCLRIGKERRRKRLYFYGQIQAFAFRRSRSEEKINWTSSLIARALRSERWAGGSHVSTWNVALCRDCISRYISFFLHIQRLISSTSLSLSLYRDCEQYTHIRVKERNPSSMYIRFSHTVRKGPSWSWFFPLSFTHKLHEQMSFPPPKCAHTYKQTL